MRNKEKFLKEKYKSKDKILYEKAIFMNSLYKKNPTELKNNFLPHGWHWIYFNENIPSVALAEDGHLERGKFIPKLSGYKRMYAGGDLVFKKDIKFGDTLNKTSFVVSITKKIKEKDNLYFIKKKNVYKVRNTTYLEEIQNLVFIKNSYKPNSLNTISYKSLRDVILKKKIKFGNVELFKFSALTFNAHRIHYDYEYTKKYEGYKNLLVHGPLLATFVLDNIREKNLTVQVFFFKILSSIFVNQEFYLKIFTTTEKNKFKAFLLKEDLKTILFYSEFRTTN